MRAKGEGGRSFSRGGLGPGVLHQHQPGHSMACVGRRTMRPEQLDRRLHQVDAGMVPRAVAPEEGLDVFVGDSALHDTSPSTPAKTIPGVWPAAPLQPPFSHPPPMVCLAGSPMIPPTVPEASREFMQEIGRELGEVRFDRMTRLLYSTDASIYQMMPVGGGVPP